MADSVRALLLDLLDASSEPTWEELIVKKRAKTCAALVLVAILLGGLAVGAQEKNAGSATTERQAASERANASAVTPTRSEVAYGPHARNVLDFYQARSERPTPLVVYIHGGGFVGGDKRSIDQTVLRDALDSGISVAAIHYRFVDGATTTFPAPQHDGARAVQFIRSKAGEWNIDPDRVACFGGSAGAGISMWIGFHDDLADPSSSDPVLRQSTRIQAVGSFGGQTTYDPIEIKALIGGRAWEHPSVFKVYALSGRDEALNPSPQVKRLYDECSAIKHLTKDDPPLFMVYSEPDAPLPDDARPGERIHHPRFGHVLKREMDKLGIENVYVHTSQASPGDVGTQMIEFFRKHLGTRTQSN